MGQRVHSPGGPKTASPIGRRLRGSAAAVGVSLAFVFTMSPAGRSQTAAPPVPAQDVTFRVSPTVAAAVDSEIRGLFQRSQEFLSAELGFTLSRPVTVFVYGSQREIFDGLVDELHAPETSAQAVAARLSFFVIGSRIFINAGAPLFLDAPRRVDRARTIAHELAHIFHNDLMMGSGAAAPLWIKEGFAVRFELRTAEHMGLHPTGNTAQEFLNLTTAAFRRGELIPLPDLGDRAQWELNILRLGADRVYAQSFVAVEYLFRTKGQPEILAYFRAFRTSRDPGLNFTRAFGIGIEAFQREFEGYLASQPH